MRLQLRQIRGKWRASKPRSLAVVLAALLGAGCGDKVQTGGAGGGASVVSTACRTSFLAPILQTELASMHARNRVPGISAALFAPSTGSSATAAVGVSSLDGGHALGPDDRFLAGSVGKTFFAALALRLAGQGRIALDAPLADILPSTRIVALTWITPRMLLSHTSGVGEYDEPFMTSLVREPLRERTREDWLDVVRRHPPDRAEAGSFRYSDLNYVLLAMVLDERTPSGAYDAIVKEFLTPLHLSGTTPAIAPSIDRLVTGYDGAGGMFGTDAMVANGKLIYNPQFEWGGGGFASTPSDLARWLAAFRQGVAFPDSLWPAVVARPPGVPATAAAWRGMGVHVGHGQLGTHVGHSGYMPGYVSWVRWYDSLGISIAIQANASDERRLPDDGFDWLDSIATRVGMRCR